MLTEYSADITCDGAGAATVYLGSTIRGQIVAIKYLPGTIATGAGLTITGSETGVAVLTKASAGVTNVWYYPFAAGNKVADGSASTVSESPVYLYKEALKVVVASGGALGAGSMKVYVDEPGAA
jgi:hypothetical protein